MKAKSQEEGKHVMLYCTALVPLDDWVLLESQEEGKHVMLYCTALVPLDDWVLL